nr:PREDICTED: ribonuclease P protein subunit p40-like [Bemisia tabaci]
MIHPEVWSFPTPHCSFTNFSTKPKDDRIPNLIDSHHFNHFVSVAVPNTLNVPETISNSLVSDCDYYKVESVPVFEFIDADFLHNFINKGKLSALSISARIDADDCACITPSKKLILVLEKVAFEELGLEGKVANSAKRAKDRFYVTIDLADGSLRPGTKLYARVQKCLKERIKLKLDFIIAWEPPEESMCPSSIAAYFDSKKYSVKLCHPKFNKQHAYNVTVPSLDSNSPSDVVDWLGAACLSAQSDEQNEYSSSYLNFYDGSPCGQLTILKWYGFFTTSRIKELYESLRSYLERSQDTPWCSLHVQGFDDSPVTFSNQEHSFLVSGDNMYTIFIKPDLSTVVATLTSSSLIRHKKQ